MAGVISVRVVVLVSVDPTDEDLLAEIARSRGSLSIADIVCNEIESNLESVSYVRHVTIGNPEEET